MSLSAAHKKDPWRWVQHSRQLLLLSFHRIFTFIIDNVYATIFITSILNIPLFCCLVLPFYIVCLIDWKMVTVSWEKVLEWRELIGMFWPSRAGMVIAGRSLMTSTYNITLGSIIILVYEYSLLRLALKSYCWEFTMTS